MRDTICLFLFGDIGDTLLAAPAIRAVRERYSDAHIIAVGKQTPLGLIQGMGLVDEAVEVEKHLFDRPSALLRPANWRRLLRLGMHLRRRRIKTLLIFHHFVTAWGTAKFAALALASGAKERVGLDNGKGWFLTDRVRDVGFGGRHEAEYWLDVASLIGARGELRPVSPRVTEADRRTARRFLGGATRSSSHLVAIHPGTGAYGPGRRWPADQFVETAAILGRLTDARFVVVGARDDATAGHEVASQLGPAMIDLVERTSLAELAAVLEQCDLVISNDSGVAHLSASVGTPVVTVFGPSNDRAWRPLLGTVVAADIGCRPCFYRDFETGLRGGCATRECLSLVRPIDVARAASELLSGRAIAV